MDAARLMGINVNSTISFTFDEHHNPVKSTAILTYVDGKPELKEMF